MTPEDKAPVPPHTHRLSLRQQSLPKPLIYNSACAPSHSSYLPHTPSPHVWAPPSHTTCERCDYHHRGAPSGQLRTAAASVHHAGFVCEWNPQMFFTCPHPGRASAPPQGAGLPRRRAFNLSVKATRFAHGRRDLTDQKRASQPRPRSQIGGLGAGPVCSAADLLWSEAAITARKRVFTVLAFCVHHPPTPSHPYRSADRCYHAD